MKLDSTIIILCSLVVAATATAQLRLEIAFYGTFREYQASGEGSKKK